jgi:hypothetical protein
MTAEQDRTSRPTEEVEARLINLLALKNFAITRGSPLSDDIIRRVGELEEKHHAYGVAWDKDDFINLDQITRAVSEVTYPITTDNIQEFTGTNGKGYYKWVHNFLWIGVISAVVSGIMMTLMKAQVAPEICEVLASIALGVVGAVLYVMLPNGKINIVAGLDRETITTNLARIITGGLLGYVIYLIIPNIYDVLSGPRPVSSKNALGLLYPLVGGYSISLVVGILSKAVTAVELTLGLDEKKNVGSLRR